MEMQIVLIAFSVVISILALYVSMKSLNTNRRFFDDQRKYFTDQRIDLLTERLYSYERVQIDHPELQKTLYDNRYLDTSFFSENTEHNDNYFRIKSYIYNHLNFFDELFTIVEGDKKFEEAFEFEDWKTYIIGKMAHPMFRELFAKENRIFGAKFRNFMEVNKEKIHKTSVDVDWY
jgi:hypothetical protein